MPHVRLFVSSRLNIDLETRFANLSRLDIVASDSDIRCYLDSEIFSNNRLSLFTSRDPTLKARILDTVSRKADGM